VLSLSVLNKYRAVGRRKLHTGFWWVNLKESGHKENQGKDERLITLAVTQAGRAFYGLLWLSIQTKYGFL
jgi:hypothetical protein